jgi:hypothetical protein
VKTSSINPLFYIKIRAVTNIQNALSLLWSKVEKRILFDDSKMTFWWVAKREVYTSDEAEQQTVKISFDFVIFQIGMSHISSLRGASLRALRSSSTVVAASKCSNYSNRSSQQQYSYSTLSPSPNRISITENNKSTKRVRIYLMLLLTSNIKTSYPTCQRNLLI